ncbi:laccase domain-containing protein [Candidatus Palauibacter polyketidifaciens]|uniref:laccase domain-containing protein n=1 Tax=Candidatus Palauibacter polyketidifaciens TaxID=3056740 RepID=UPI0023A3D275|nr:laccase domain-containing protein [Candidatus Palauibacter polyketidifaciens]MDE2721076.1 laccase domain-containing protein [Candidatus Palauibacter polyketidifaciens]
MTEVAETPKDGLLRLSQWESLDPTVVCGITTAERGDLAVADVPPERVAAVYADLARELGFRRVSVPTQVHGTDLREIRGAPAADPAVCTVDRPGRVDGQLVDGPGWLLAATAADCVPVYLWSRELGRIGLIHAGWRGAAAGILPRAISRLVRGLDRRPSGAIGDLRVHLGPAICGRCYEVDTPVLSAFGLGGTRARLDLREILAAQAATAGVAPDALSSSRYCTSCGPGDLHSHRASGGAAGRMAAFLGLRSG